MNDVVCVKTSSTRSEADLAKAVIGFQIGFQGIKAMECGDDSGVAGFYAEIIFTPSVELVIARSDVRKASRTLRPMKT
jgi:hypothetical protein